MSEHKWIHDQASFKQHDEEEDTWEERWRHHNLYTYKSSHRLGNEENHDCLICFIISLRCVFFTLIDFKKACGEVLRNE